MSDQVLVRNACTTPLRWVSWERAVTAVVLDQAEIIVADEGRQIRSEYLTLPWPLEIQLRKYTFVPYVGFGGDPVPRATRRAILTRDRQKCAYCGGVATTIDHVFPRSRGGLDTWENLVAACYTCNQAKGDKTPEESGMKLLWPPRLTDLRVRNTAQRR